MDEPTFLWPSGFDPGSARLYIRNTRTMKAPVEQIWSWLVAAPLWPAWFPNATKIELLDGDTQLRKGTRFRWSQSGVILDSTVREYIPNRRLAWFASSRLVTAYHAWDMQNTAEGVGVITDETQRGLMPTMLGPLLKPRMLAIHDRWLALLEEQATMGFPLPSE